MDQHSPSADDAWQHGNFHDTVDGCEILHHQVRMVFQPQNNGMVIIYQLVQEFATIHSISDYQRIEFD